MPAGERIHLTVTLDEADRLMTVCNACRYCEGLCAVFPAMEQRRIFLDGDLDYLANLCHNCGACLYDCQYAPPHEFAVNVPANLAKLRKETYERYAWPAPLAKLYRRNGTTIAGATALGVAGFVAAVGLTRDADVFLGRQRGEGAFYRIVPHATIVVVFSVALLYSILAIGLSVRRYWRAIDGGKVRLADLAGAGKSASTLEYLDGGGVGCMNDDEEPTDNRRVFHHLTYYGFLLCLLSTTLAAILETGFDKVAPYPLYHPVVVFGALGGLGLVIGPAGLFRAKTSRDPELVDRGSRSMEVAFLSMLVSLGLTGFAVLVLRATAFMGPLLAIHLGVVFAFFVTLPYGKFVHGMYRYAALAKYGRERREFGHSS